MSLRQQIRDEQMDAMKKNDASRLSILRMVWVAIRNEEINTRTELDDATITTVIGRQVKQLEDALGDFTAAGRNDLITKTQGEIDLLRTYLPKAMTDEEIETVVRQIATDLGATTAADMGKVMGAAMKAVTGRADGNRVRQIVGKVLGS